MAISRIINKETALAGVLLLGAPAQTVLAEDEAGPAACRSYQETAFASGPEASGEDALEAARASIEDMVWAYLEDIESGALAAPRETREEGERSYQGSAPSRAETAADERLAEVYRALLTQQSEDRGRAEQAALAEAARHVYLARRQLRGGGPYCTGLEIGHAVRALEPLRGERLSADDTFAGLQGELLDIGLARLARLLDHPALTEAGLGAELNAAYDEALALRIDRDFSAAADLLGQVGGSVFGIIRFSLDRFEDNIRSLPYGPTVGYTYAINRNGALARQGSEGWARLGPTALAQHPDKPMNVASTGKVLTAVAVLKMLELLGDARPTSEIKIGPYLPPGWPRGSGVNDITFYQLLTHRSGLGGATQWGSDDWNSLKSAVSMSVGAKSYQYENANFGLFRVLIPGMLFGAQTYNHPLMTGFAYAAFVYQNILQPVGVSTGPCDDIEPWPTLLYAFPAGNTPGAHKGNELLLCGGGGWYLSSVDWMRILGAVRGGGVLSAAREDELYGLPFVAQGNVSNSFALGWDIPIAGVFGSYLAKNGGFTLSGGQGVRTCIAEFPFGVQVSLSVNAANTMLDSPGICVLLAGAYDNAWSSGP